MSWSKPFCPLILLALLTIFSGCDREPETGASQRRERPFQVAILVVSDLYVSLSAEGLKEGMRELGYQEGKDVQYQVYNAEGDREKLKSLVDQALEFRPDVICPSIVTAIDAVRASGTKIPAVFLESMYPVEFGIVDDLIRPGNNYTGVSNMTGPMSGKRLELLTRIDPRVERVAVIFSPDNKVAALSLEGTRAAARELDLQLDVYPVNNPEELDSAIETIRNSEADGLVINPDFLVFSRLVEIIAMTRQKRIPTMGIDSSQVRQGILAGYGGELREIAKQAAGQVDRVLRGESPAVIPVEAPKKYHLTVNIATAEQIGLKLPQEILYQAERYYR